MDNKKPNAWAGNVDLQLTLDFGGTLDTSFPVRIPAQQVQVVYEGYDHRGFSDSPREHRIEVELSESASRDLVRQLPKLRLESNRVEVLITENEVSDCADMLEQNRTEVLSDPEGMRQLAVRLRGQLVNVLANVEYHRRREVENLDAQFNDRIDELREQVRGFESISEDDRSMLLNLLRSKRRVNDDEDEDEYHDGYWH